MKYKAKVISFNGRFGKALMPVITDWKHDHVCLWFHAIDLHGVSVRKGDTIAFNDISEAYRGKIISGDIIKI